MSDHLPECPMLDEQYTKHPLENCDYCNMLRACEQRVLDAIDLPAANVQYQKVGYKFGYAAGLDAAREAVETLDPLLAVTKHKGGYDCCGCDTPDKLLYDALVAIDALREKP